jgi:Skp family chaperone for outer membrane proteins
MNSRTLFFVLAGVGIVGLTCITRVQSEQKPQIIPPVNQSLPEGTPDLRVRYVDGFAAMRECEEGKKVAGEIESKRKKLAEKIEGEEKKIAQAMNEYKVKMSTMSQEARLKEEQRFARMKTEYESMVREADEEMKLVMAQATEKLAKQFDVAVADMAKHEGLDVVVDITTGRVVYTTHRANFTAKIVTAMNDVKKTPQQTGIALAAGKKPTGAAA